MTKIRAIAVVLPQYHPIPENNNWWGEGFTEWTNVTKAKPFFKDHYQPHLPAELGFYDLRLEEVRAQQAKLAQENGIHGFCYYHYWFGGKRLLNKPIDEILKLKKPDMPFMLCWANETWSRRWVGKEEEVLIHQGYNNSDDIAHMEWLCKNVFKDPRYIKVNDCPVFIVFRTYDMPNIKRTSEIWRKIAKKHGFKDLYLCFFESSKNKVKPNEINFNAAIEFSPSALWSNPIFKSRIEVLLNRMKLKKKSTLKFTDYLKSVDQSLKYKPDYKLFRSVTPSWDNTARKGKLGTISLGSSPENYKFWLKGHLENFEPFSSEENFIFINAMNEWAEGNHLEPCRKYGRGFLEATKECLYI